MTCANKYFTNSDYSIEFGTLTNFSVSDISSLAITLTHSADNSIVINKAAQINGSTVFFKIEETDVTVAGMYNIKAVLTDTSGNITTLCSDPEQLEFIDA